MHPVYRFLMEAVYPAIFFLKQHLLPHEKPRWGTARGACSPQCLDPVHILTAKLELVTLSDVLRFILITETESRRIVARSEQKISKGNLPRSCRQEYNGLSCGGLRTKSSPCPTCYASGKRWDKNSISLFVVCVGAGYNLAPTLNPSAWASRATQEEPNSVM